MSLLTQMFGTGWNVAYRRAPQAAIMQNHKTMFELIPNTWRTWVADPFVFQYKGDIYIFAEVFDYLTRKGTIGYCRYINGNWTRWKTAISEPFHMSYPNVFIHNGQVCMIPETSEDHTLRLYRAVSFPDNWVLEKIIADSVSWVDTTLFEHGGHLYGITRDISDLNNQEDLLLCFDDQWNLLEYEKINETKPENSRSGGNFVMFNDGALRVTQDCCEHYGRALIFSTFRPETLATNGLDAILVRMEAKDLPIKKNKRWIGMHTYNSSAGIEVIDIERRRYNPLWFIGLLIWKIGTYLPGERK